MAQPQGCRLQQLPPEIRNRVFSLAVIKDGSTLITRKKKAEGNHTLGPGLPPIALTCRQFYNEVAPVFYGNNTFLVYLPIRNFRQIIGEVKCFDMTRWMQEAEERANILIPRSEEVPGAVRRVKLVIPHLPYDDAAAHDRTWGALLVSSTDGIIKLETCGIMQKKCMCIPRRIVAVNNQLRQFASVVTQLEQHCTEHLVYPKLWAGQSEQHCEKCGLLRTVQPDLIQDDIE